MKSKLKGWKAFILKFDISDYEYLDKFKKIELFFKMQKSKQVNLEVISKFGLTFPKSKVSLSNLNLKSSFIYTLEEC